MHRAQKGGGQGKNKAAVELGRRGGIARAKALKKSDRVRIAKRAAAARWKASHAK